MIATDFVKPSFRFNRGAFTACKSCQACRQYQNKETGELSTYCRKATRSEWWPIESDSICPKHERRSVSDDPFAVEDVLVFEAVLDLESTLACTFINERFSPQASGAFEKSKNLWSNLRESEKEACEVQLQSVLPRTETLQLVYQILAELSKLREGKAIPQAAREGIMPLAEQLIELRERW